jgi:hypothetical protein
MPDGAIDHQTLVKRGQQEIFGGFVAVADAQDDQSGKRGFDHGPVLFRSAGERSSASSLSQKSG